MNAQFLCDKTRIDSMAPNNENTRSKIACVVFTGIFPSPVKQLAKYTYKAGITYKELWSAVIQQVFQ